MWLQRRAFHGVVTHNRAISQNFVLPARSYSGSCSYSLSQNIVWHAYPSRLEASIAEGSHYATAVEQNLSRLLRSVSCMNFFTQLLALVHLLSRCYTPAAYSKCRHQNTTAISCTLDRCAHSDCHSWLSFITVIQAHPSLLHARASSCMKISLTLC